MPSGGEEHLQKPVAEEGETGACVRIPSLPRLSNSELWELYGYCLGELNTYKGVTFQRDSSPIAAMSGDGIRRNM